MEKSTVATYLEWNDAIASHFFRPEMEGRAVYLYVTEEVIKGVGASLESTRSDFIKGLHEGPPWTTRDGFCQKALQTLNGWRAKGLGWPPYIGYLAAFVLAAGMEGDYALHAYYPRLRELLGFEPGGMLPSFDRMLELWDDLERWSVHDKDGSLGLFEARITGSWIHVGLPRAQTLLTERERHNLPTVFARAGFDPSLLPSDFELLCGLRESGAGLLRPQTLRLLASERSDAKNLQRCFLDVVEEESGEWERDTAIEDSGNSDVSESGQIVHMGILRLNLRFDPVSRRAQLFLRAQLPREYPDGGLLLHDEQSGDEFLCDELRTGVSTRLEEASSGKPADGARFDWSRGATLKERRLGWVLKLRAQKIRFFVNGRAEGLPDLVESFRLPADQEVFLACAEDLWPKVESWGFENCTTFERIGNAHGLPRGWVLARLDGARSGPVGDSVLATLSISERIRVKLRGLRVTRGNTFFSFAPPIVVVDGGDGSESVFCEGRQGRRAKQAAAFELPARLPVDEKLVIEIRRQDETIARRSFVLREQFDWRSVPAKKRLDRLGRGDSDDPDHRAIICGAIVDDSARRPVSFARPILLLEEVREADHDRVFLVGQNPGQIVKWPAEQGPDGWDPVWAIPIHKRGRAIYCGVGIDVSKPHLHSDQPRKRRKMWKELLWHWRKRIVEPTHPRLRLLWREYVEIARRV